MALSPVPNFNSSFDLDFANLINQQNLVSTGNLLVNIQPSSFNLSQNCWITCDLATVSRNADSQNDPGIIPIVTNNLQAILSQNVAPDASELDYIEYWRGLKQMPVTSQIFEEACNWCNASEQLSIPPAALNFEANCTLIGGFYSRYYGSADLALDYADLVLFFTASLPSLDQNTTPTTNEAIAASIWNHSTPCKPLKTPVLPLKVPYAILALDATARCAQEACQGLDYSGNTDLGGIGSLAKYLIITAMTTIFAVLLVHYEKHRDFHWEFRNDLRDNVITTSIMSWDAITWLPILTLVAALMVWKQSPRTLYEAVLTLHSSELSRRSLDLAGVSRTISSRPSIYSQYFARIIIMDIRLAMLREETLATIQGLDCRYLVSSLYPVLWAFVWIVKTVFVHEEGLSTTSSAQRFQIVRSKKLLDWSNTVLAYLSAILSLCVLRFDVVCIYTFRLDARYYFGEAYDDDSFGCGQMLAAGFATQPVINFFFVLYCNVCSTPAAHNNVRSRLPLLLVDRVWPKPKPCPQIENSQRREEKDRREIPPSSFSVGSGVYESSGQSGYSTEAVPWIENTNRKAWGAGHRHNSG